MKQKNLGEKAKVKQEKDLWVLDEVGKKELRNDILNSFPADGDEVKPKVIIKPTPEVPSAVIEEDKLISRVSNIDLLTLEGIESRLKLVDRLLLRDTKDQSNKRAQTIQRLQMNTDAARGYVETILAGKPINDTITAMANKYKFLVVTTIKEVLDRVVGRAKSRDILREFGAKMELLEGMGPKP